jgi:hypothetical protein
MATQKPSAKAKPNTKISPSRAYELADSLMNTTKTRIGFGKGTTPQERLDDQTRKIRTRNYNYDKSIRLKTRADEAVEKAGGVKADLRLGDRYNRRWDSNASVDNKAVGRDMPLPPSSELFNA